MRQSVAYDYEAQRWVKGEAAVTLLKAQLGETLACLEGPRGADYLACTRKASDPVLTVAEASAAIRAQLGAL